MVGSLLLSGKCFGSPWPSSSDGIASHKLEWVSGAYSDCLALQWDVDDGYDAGNAALTICVKTDTGTVGSMFKDDVSLVCAAGAGMYSKCSSVIRARRSCGHLDDVGTQECRLF